MLPPPVTESSPAVARAEGRRLVRFGGCNYLGLAQHPRTIAAAVAAMGRFGLSSSASRTTTGNTAEHEALEAELAGFCGHEDACLLPEGYTANIAAMQGLSRSGIRTVLLDARSHRSLADAARTAGLVAIAYRHADHEDARRLARAVRGRVAIATDGVFSADGDLAPLAELLDALPTADSVLLVDDCHGFCTQGPRGEGTLAEVRLADRRLAVTTTLAKGLGAAGGAVLGTRAFMGEVRAAPCFVGTTPCAPPLAAAAREALRVLADEPERLARLRANIDAARATLRAAGLPARDRQTPIFSFTLRDEQAMTAAHAAWRDAGLEVPLIRYPGGPAPLYFRMSVTSEHLREHLELLARCLNAQAARPAAATVPA
jgi:8-amino-7-oxononanoate synthase